MTTQNGNNQHHSQVVVVMVPLPAQGHLNQLLHLSHLITSYNIPVHFACSAAHNHQAKLRLQGWGSETTSSNKIHFHDLELPPYNSPTPIIDPSTPFPKHLESLFEASTHLRQPICNLLQKLSSKFTRVIVIHDVLMTYVVQDVKLISNAETYNFIPTSAFASFTYAWDFSPEETKRSFPDLNIHIPTNEGCSTQGMMEFARNQYKFVGFESGSIYNTSKIIEGEYVDLLEKIHSKTQPHISKNFFLGPFNPVEIAAENRAKKGNDCLEWLDQQEIGSVIYVSFGSTTSLTDEQIEELANGLDRSGVKFLWVLRRADPNDVFGEADKVRKPQLSEGYEEKVKGRGMVVRDWAPQLDILAHSSVGGFMSHCGWNSCIESMSLGVPIAAWPMHSEQPRNAVLVTDVLKIGVLVRQWERRCEVVKSSRVEEVVKTLMASEEGKEMRRRAAEIGQNVASSVGENGATSLERDSFIAHISR